MVVVLGLLAFVIEFAFLVGVFLLASGAVGGGAVGSAEGVAAGRGVGATVAGVLAVVVVAGLWALLVAPKARRRLPKIPRALAAGTAVAIVGAGLLGLGHQRFGPVLIGAGPVLAWAQVALDDLSPSTR